MCPDEAVFPGVWRSGRYRLPKWFTRVRPSWRRRQAGAILRLSGLLSRLHIVSADPIYSSPRVPASYQRANSNNACNGSAGRCSTPPNEYPDISQLADALWDLLRRCRAVESHAGFTGDARVANSSLLWSQMT